MILPCFVLRFSYLSVYLFTCLLPISPTRVSIPWEQTFVCLVPMMSLVPRILSDPSQVLRNEALNEWMDAGMNVWESWSWDLCLGWGQGNCFNQQTFPVMCKELRKFLKGIKHIPSPQIAHRFMKEIEAWTNDCENMQWGAGKMFWRVQSKKPPLIRATRKSLERVLSLELTLK